MSSSNFPAATILGYPRIGPQRELKKALESFWKGESSADALESSARELRLHNLARMVEHGLKPDDSSLPSNFSFYDHVLDAAVTCGAVPPRFASFGTDNSDLVRYSVMARGEGHVPPLEMTKWCDSNYHYLVPEIGPETVFSLSSRRWIDEFREAKEAGFLTRPVITGPLTFLAFAKASDEAPEGFEPLSRLDDLVPVYAELLQEFAAAGAEWVQCDEPILVMDTDIERSTLLSYARSVYSALAETSGRPALCVAAPYHSLDDTLPALIETGVEALALDLVRGDISPDIDLTDVTISAGIVDGHNIWRTNLDEAQATIAALADRGANVTVSTSTSLFHVPHTLEGEDHLGEELLSWLSFAHEKITEVVALAGGEDAYPEAFAQSRAAVASRAAHAGTHISSVRNRLERVQAADSVRSDYATRAKAQAARLGLPSLTTTTIGSFPQTPEIRAARASWAKGTLSDADYEQAMKDEIASVVALQEELGLDVLVHGEAERNDMVQYFAELLDGCAVTTNGWVQSYGSRCTRPSIVWGDVSRPDPMTVRWSSYAQSLSDKPVKAMLTGPVTILAWSFVRDDQPVRDTAFQVALALRDEIADLEAAGMTIIQVDEPALRELLPLKHRDQAAYLDWAVTAFRLATSGVHDETQVHTHLCYSEFGEVIDAIDGLDADVTSIEAARSRMEVLPAIKDHGYERGIGPGVWDIHSPRVPSVEELTELLTLASRSVPSTQLWVNPDCGLKTRGYEETTESLRNMIAATRNIREQVQ